MENKMANYFKELSKLEARKGVLLDDLKETKEKIDSAESDDQRVEMEEKFDAIGKKIDGINAEGARISKIAEYEDAETKSFEPVKVDDTIVAGKDEPKKFEKLGEMLQAVANASRVGSVVDPRLTIGAAATGLSEGVASDGGFLVQTQMASELVKPIFEGGAIASRVRKIGIGSNAKGLKMNAIDETARAAGSRWGGVRAYWESEAGTLTASTPKFRQIELNLKKLIGLCYSTDELLQDASALGGVMGQAFADEFTFMVEDSIINGTGAGTPLGILTSAAKISQAKETGQDADTIVAENIENMYSRMPASSISKAIWTINQDCWPQIFQLKHTVGAGGVPMFMPAGKLTDTPSGSLMGRPIVPTEYNGTIGDLGDIAFLDLSQYLTIDKGGTQTASSIHVSFTTDQTVFRFVYRIDGQPTIAAPLTPYKSAITLSPFVFLAAR